MTLEQIATIQTYQKLLDGWVCIRSLLDRTDNGLTERDLNNVNATVNGVRRYPSGFITELDSSRPLLNWRTYDTPVVRNFDANKDHPGDENDAVVCCPAQPGEGCPVSCPDCAE